jgi:hypothetical protein
MLAYIIKRLNNLESIICDYAGFSVIAIKAVHEQQQIIEKQQFEIDLLKKQVQSTTEQLGKKIKVRTAT